MKKTFNLKGREVGEQSTIAQFILIDSAEQPIRVKVDEKYSFDVNAGDQVEIAIKEKFEVENLSDLDNKVVVRYGLGKFHPQTDSQKVSIVGEPWLAGLRNPIQVESSATVENGKMSILPATGMNEISDTIIEPNGIIQFVPGRLNSTNRKVLIQIITPDADIDHESGLSKIRIGASPTLTKTQGVYLQGSLDNSQSFEIETSTALYIRNMTGNNVVVTGIEQWR